MSKAQKNFLNGALILSSSALIAKAISAVYKIPLANMIDTVGMNYYNDAYQIYALLFMLATGGVPVAIAKMVSETIVNKRLKEPRKILKVSALIFGILGILFSVLLAVFVEPLSHLLASETANHCITLIAPSIFMVSVSATVKGYFQGYKCMTPTAVYQVIEPTFKLAGLAIVGVMLLRGVTDPMILACGGVLGVTSGAFAATVFMLIRYLTEKDFGRNTEESLPSRSGWTIAKLVATIAVPITLSSSVTSITNTLDMFLVKWGLGQYGLDNDAIKSVYGAYSGGTSSLFNLVPSLITSVGVSVLPFITSALAAKNQEEAFRNMRSSSKVVALLAIPSAVGMTVMSEPIVKLLYRQSYWDVTIPTLRLMGISIFFVSFVSLTAVFLQAAGKVKLTLLTTAIGALMKLAVNMTMVPEIGIMGAPLGTFACYGTIAVLNIIFIKKYTGFRFPLKSTFLKPAFCGLVCCGGAYGIWAFLCFIGLSQRLAVLPALAAAVVIYGVLLLLLKVLNKEDLSLLPKRVGAILERKGWVHE